MTSKQKVLKVYPDAYSVVGNHATIYRRGKEIGFSGIPHESWAWADALMRIKKEATR